MNIKRIPQQQKKNSRAMRLWHWANALVISESLLTVLIASTLTDDHKISPVLKSEFAKTGIHLNNDQTDAVAEVLGDKTWTVHIYFGYVLAGLLLFRLLFEFFLLPEKRLISRLSAAYRQFCSMKQKRKMAMNSVLVKLIYGCFYLLLFVMVLTGLGLAFRLKPFSHELREIHGFCMYLIIAFIVVHVAGIFLSERKDSPGIISDMVNGGNIGSKDKFDQ